MGDGRWVPTGAAAIGQRTMLAPTTPTSFAGYARYPQTTPPPPPPIAAALAATETLDHGHFPTIPRWSGTSVRISPIPPPTGTTVVATRPPPLAPTPPTATPRPLGTLARPGPTRSLGAATGR